MKRRFILDYHAKPFGPWGHMAAFRERFVAVFGEPNMAAYQKLADLLQCSEDTARRLYLGREGDRYIQPKAFILPVLESVMGVAPGTWGGTEPTKAPELPFEGDTPGLHKGKDTMPMGGELEESTPVTGADHAGFYEVSLSRVASPWALMVLRNLPPNLGELDAQGKLPVYLQLTDDRALMTIPHLTAGAKHPWSGVFIKDELTRLLQQAKPIDATKAFLVMAITRDILVADAVEKTAGTVKMEDVLGTFRAGIGDLCRLNDDLKVLQVDTEDVAQDPATTDPRIGYIAKRLRTIRVGISALLRNTFPNPQ